MDFLFIKYSALVLIAAVIGLAGIIASSSPPIVTYDKAFGLISSPPAGHMISVSSKVKTSGPATSGGSQSGASKKVVMINFDDGYKSQLLYAKPILDQYGYKATFFIPCAKMGTEQPKWLTW